MLLSKETMARRAARGRRERGAALIYAMIVMTVTLIFVGLLFSVPKAANAGVGYAITKLSASASGAVSATAGSPVEVAFGGRDGNNASGTLVDAFRYQITGPIGTTANYKVMSVGKHLSRGGGGRKSNLR